MAKIGTLMAGMLLSAAAVAAERGELGANDFRISFQQGTGNAAFEARRPAVAYNSTDREYLVVWQGEFQLSFPNCPGTGPVEQEIFGQRVDAVSGALLGAAEKISSSGPSCDNMHTAFRPAVAYNDKANEYLVVWYGDDDAGGLANQEFEIFGQRLDAAGMSIGADDFRISDMGGTGNASFDAFDPDVVWNASSEQYLVVWHGDDDTGDLVNEEFEIYGQLLDADGVEVGSNDFRISDVGVDGNTAFRATDPALGWNAATNQYFVVWEGSNLAPGAGELEIYGQRLRADGTEIGSNDYRISFQQGTGDPNFRAKLPDLAYDSNRHEYLVVWQGEFQPPPPTCAAGSPTEQEIFGQRIDANTGVALGAAAQISRSGPACDDTHMAFIPAATYDAGADEYLVAWFGDDAAGGLVDNEFEIFARRFDAGPLPAAGAAMRISEMGGTGSELYDAVLPAVTWSAADGYFVVWHGDDNEAGLIDDELEIFGQRLAAPIFADGFE